MENTTVKQDSHMSYFIAIIVVCLVGGGATFAGYKIGKANGKLEGALTAIKQNPPNIYNCTTAKVDQSVKKQGSGLALTIKKMHVGLWWDAE